MLGRRRIRDVGPVGWLALAAAIIGIGLATQRTVRGARHPEAQPRAAQDANLLLVVLSVACGMLSLLLGPR